MEKQSNNSFLMNSMIGRIYKIGDVYMYGIYKGKKCRVAKISTFYRVISSKKEEGFEEYIDIVGEKRPDIFVKDVDIHELDYLYRTVYEIQYKGHFFDVMSTMKRINIDEDWFAIRAGIEKYELIEKLGFEVYDKGEWRKEIGRKDIEALKIIEKPLKIFKEQGLKAKILAGKDIDDFLASVKD